MGPQRLTGLVNCGYPLNACRRKRRGCVDARVREVDDLGSGEGEGGRGGRVLFEGRRVDEIFPLTNCPRHQHLIIELANANENEDF